MSKFFNDGFRPLHVRDNLVFLKGNTKGPWGGESGANIVVAGNSNPGAYPDVPCVIGIYHTFGEATQPGNIRSIDVEQLFNFGAVTDITSGQSIAAIRGAVTHAEGTSFGSGVNNEYSYGVQGKQTVQTLVKTSAGFVAALFGQLDMSSNLADVESGYVSALQLDMGASIGTGMDAAALAFVNAETILNTTSGLINSIFKVTANATYFADLTDLAAGGAHWITGTTGSTAGGCLKVLINGSVRYIQLFTTVA
jgi:hypothetical protein